MREHPALTRVRAVARDLKNHTAAIPEREVARVALAREGLAASSVRARDGAILFDAEVEGGRIAHARIVPEPPRFATRGAKELVFRVEPPDAAGDKAVRDFVGALAALVARTAWSAALKPRSDASEGAFVEREGDVLHVDLRTVPSVRAALSSPAGAVVEAISLERIEAHDGAVRIVFGLPRLG